MGPASGRHSQGQSQGPSRPVSYLLLSGSSLGTDRVGQLADSMSRQGSGQSAQTSEGPTYQPGVGWRVAGAGPFRRLCLKCLSYSAVPKRTLQDQGGGP